MLDDLRTYLQMASGLTEATTSKARDVISGLISTGLSLSTKAMPAPEMMGQVQELADDLVATSKNNRDVLTGMIRSEVDKAVGRMGFVREEELAALRRHVQRLEQQVHELAAAARQEAAPEEAAPEEAAPEEAAPAADPESVDAAAPEEKPAKKKKKIIVDPEAGS
ncbi:MAG: polyhydroxyalkanoate synthesis protein PhaF [Actinomycetales bacterium]|nr:polyhydroxyalkanoate synthesis protein PhaF [Actinomycetales bacterium]